MRKDNWPKSVALACLILGFLIAVQFKTQRSKGFPLYKQRSEELVKIINELEKEKNKLRVEVEQAREQIKSFQEAANRGESMVQAMKNQAELSKLEAGFVEVEGPGIEIELRDSVMHPKSGDDPYFYLVHDVDLQSLVNELKAVGGEAISINGQRLVSTSSIRCAGPVIYVNAERLTSPYMVQAIGPANEMEIAIKMPGGYVDSLALNIKKGVEVKIVKKEKIIIPAYKGSLVFRYAKPVQKKEGN